MPNKGVGSLIRDNDRHISDRQGAARDPLLAARVRDALAGREQKWLADVTGISPKTINNFANGQMTAADNAVKCAQALGVTAEWLISGVGPRRQATLELADNTEWLFLPRYEIAKMWDLQTKPPAEETMPLRRDMLERHVPVSGDLWVARMLGNALPDVAGEGELILCQDVHDRYEDGRPYVLFTLAGPIFRRVFVTPAGLQLRAENPMYETVQLPPDDNLDVYPIGRILGSLTLRRAP